MSEHVHTPTCRQLLGNLSEYIDGALQLELCLEIEEHLKGCENCRIVVDTLKKTVEIYQKTVPTADIPEEVKDRLFLKLKLTEFIHKSN